MHYFEEKYPAISEIYYEYINSDDHAKHPITVYADRNNDKLTAEALAYMEKGDKSNAEDKIMCTCSEYEHAGFIHGFSYALKIFKEAGVLPVCPT